MSGAVSRTGFDPEREPTPGTGSARVAPRERRTRGAALVAALIDVAAIVIFVAIGRSNHGHVVNLAGLASTAWPFLAGCGLGWVAARAWRQPRCLRTSVVIWLSCVILGMVLRVVAGQGTAVAFVGVALAFLGMELLGWRLLVAVVLHRRRAITVASDQAAPS